MIKFRVCLKVGYNDMYLEYDTIAEAGALAMDILTHVVTSDDVRTKPVYVNIKAVDIEREKEENEDE